MLNPHIARKNLIRLIEMLPNEKVLEAQKALEKIFSQIDKNQKTEHKCPEEPLSVETRRKRTITAREAAGSMIHYKTSTEIHYQNRREEIELEDEKLRRHFGGKE